MLAIFAGCAKETQEIKETPVRSIHLAYMTRENIRGIPPDPIKIYPDIQYYGRIDYFNDGQIKCKTTWPNYCYNRQKELDLFADKITNFLPDVKQVTPADIIKTDKYFEIYKNMEILYVGGVEIDPEVGEVYLKNKWVKENPKITLIDHIIDTGYVSIYKESPSGQVISFDKNKKLTLYIQGKPNPYTARRRPKIDTE